MRPPRSVQPGGSPAAGSRASCPIPLDERPGPTCPAGRPARPPAGPPGTAQRLVGGAPGRDTRLPDRARVRRRRDAPSGQPSARSRAAPDRLQASGDEPRGSRRRASRGSRARPSRPLTAATGGEHRRRGRLRSRSWCSDNSRAHGRRGASRPRSTRRARLRPDGPATTGARSRSRGFSPPGAFRSRRGCPPGSALPSA